MPSTPDGLVVAHRRVENGHDGSRRWQVEMRDMPMLEVELPADERATLELTDDELHELLPTALERHGVEEARDVPWDTPVRLYADHFRG
jgi:hypothetical protein